MPTTNVVILDMAPSLDVLHVSALIASDWVIILTKLNAMAVDGINEVLRSMGEVVEHGPRLGYSILPTFFDRTTRKRLCSCTCVRCKCRPKNHRLLNPRLIQDFLWF